MRHDSIIQTIASYCEDVDFAIYVVSCHLLPNVAIYLIGDDRRVPTGSKHNRTVPGTGRANSKVKVNSCSNK